jgi:hypothetical protein
LHPGSLVAGATTAQADQGQVVVQRHLASVTLDANQIALLKQSNGARSIREIVDLVTPPETFSRVSEVEHLAMELFQRLWALDIVQIRLRSTDAVQDLLVFHQHLAALL